jgi:probable phosphoglycerate mutase
VSPGRSGDAARPAPTTIVLVRHGETDWNAASRVQGQSDRPLTARGREQARTLADALTAEPLDAVYSSDLSRARDTAEAIAGPRGLDVRTHPGLREKDFGTWEGLTDTEVFARYPEARRGHWGDGETPEELRERVLGSLREISARHPGQRLLVVTHGGPLRVVLRHCEVEWQRPIANCEVARIQVDDGKLRSLD